MCAGFFSPFNDSVLCDSGTHGVCIACAKTSNKNLSSISMNGRVPSWNSSTFEATKFISWVNYTQTHPVREHFGWIIEWWHNKATTNIQAFWVSKLQQRSTHDNFTKIAISKNGIATHKLNDIITHIGCMCWPFYVDISNLNCYLPENKVAHNHVLCVCINESPNRT